ncbi:MAG: ABC transporter permease [archaeon]|nr:MAG: ABC transporter permease [archaeon]
MRFFRDLGIMFVTEVKRYYRWKERILWDVLFALIAFFGFVLVWRAVIMGGFQGLGDLTPENYITFLLSGSLIWVVISQGIGWHITFAFKEDKHRRVLPYIMLSPLNKIAYLYGKLGVGLLRTVISNLIIIVIALFAFDFFYSGSIILTVLFFLLTFLAFSGIGLIIASLAAVREGIADFSFVLVQILYLLSGVYYPIEVFPESIRNVVVLLPTTQAIIAVRSIGLYGAGSLDIMPQIIYIGILAVIAPILGYLTFRWVKNKAMLIGI